VDFFKYNWKKETWSLLFVLGIFIGGALTQWFLSDGQPVKISQSTHNDLMLLGISDFSTIIPKEIFSWSKLWSLQGFIFIVLGGFMVGFGSRYAGGCTSGHAITGLSNFQLASLVAVCGFFAGGLIVTHLLLPYLMH
jgi:hypothetical protein